MTLKWQEYFERAAQAPVRPEEACFFCLFFLSLSAKLLSRRASGAFQTAAEQQEKFAAAVCRWSFALLWFCCWIKMKVSAEIHTFTSCPLLFSGRNSFVRLLLFFSPPFSSSIFLLLSFSRLPAPLEFTHSLPPSFFPNGEIKSIPQCPHYTNSAFYWESSDWLVFTVCLSEVIYASASFVLWQYFFLFKLNWLKGIEWYLL